VLREDSKEQSAGREALSKTRRQGAATDRTEDRGLRIEDRYIKGEN